MKSISIVLTKYSDTLSKLMHFFGGGYTHASIALEAAGDIMYSFNYKGFCVETLSKHRQRGGEKSMCIHLHVSDIAYAHLQRSVEQFEMHKEDFRYTRMGVLFCLLQIPFKWKKHYFCSHFVAQMLSESGAVELSKKSFLYLPNHFCQELGQSRQLQAIQYNII